MRKKPARPWMCITCACGFSRIFFLLFHIILPWITGLLPHAISRHEMIRASSPDRLACDHTSKTSRLPNMMEAHQRSKTNTNNPGSLNISHGVLLHHRHLCSGFCLAFFPFRADGYTPKAQHSDFLLFLFYSYHNQTATSCVW